MDGKTFSRGGRLVCCLKGNKTKSILTLSVWPLRPSDIKIKCDVIWENLSHVPKGETAK